MTWAQGGQAILDVFARRGAIAGTVVRFTDFGDALPWESGAIATPEARKGFVALVERGLVRELAAGLELTDAGAQRLALP